MKTIPKDDGGIEQFNGREGETATLLSRCPLNSGGLGGGFAPRHLSRSLFLGFNNGCIMKALFQTLTFSILLSFGSLLAYACSCDVPSQRREFKDADAVFVGEVLEFKERAAESETNEDLILFPYQVTFKIEKQWKGERQSQIIALTDSAIGPCGGFDVTVGDRFIIYAQRKSGQLTFWRACFRNRKADDAKDEIKKLGKFFRADAFLYPKFWKNMFENDDTANKSLDARQKQPLFKIYFG